jgi:hypothetical protein
MVLGSIRPLTSPADTRTAPCRGPIDGVLLVWLIAVQIVVCAEAIQAHRPRQPGPRWAMTALLPLQADLPEEHMHSPA